MQPTDVKAEEGVFMRSQSNKKQSHRKVKFWSSNGKVKEKKLTKKQIKEIRDFFNNIHSI